MNINQKEKLIEKLKDKKYRDAFVSEHIDTGLPFQIRALREQRGWSQEELGKQAGMHQERISKLEDPNYAKFTLKTLKRLASGFDVALMVVFVPFSRLVYRESNLSPESLEATSFDQEEYFKEKTENELGLDILKNNYSKVASQQSDNATTPLPLPNNVLIFDHYRPSNKTKQDYQNLKSEGAHEAALG